MRPDKTAVLSGLFCFFFLLIAADGSRTLSLKKPKKDISITMTIDLLTIEEYDAMVELWQRAGLHFDRDDRDSRRRIEEQIYDDHVVILTLKDDDGKMIGVIVGSYDGRKGWINRLAIDPDYRGRRLAARLIERAEEVLIDMGATIIAALIEDENLPSMAAFRNCGYEGWSHIVYFRKKLKPQG